MSDKPNNPKAQLYACIFPTLQELAKGMGYNLVLHGSLGRDFDLIAVPWEDNPKPELELIQAMHSLLTGGNSYQYKEQYLHSIMPGGRSNYQIILSTGKVNKFGIWKNSEQCEWYLDINVTPLISTTNE